MFKALDTRANFFCLDSNRLFNMVVYQYTYTKFIRTGHVVTQSKMCPETTPILLQYCLSKQAVSGDRFIYSENVGSSARNMQLFEVMVYYGNGLSRQVLLFLHTLKQVVLPRSSPVHIQCI